MLNVNVYFQDIEDFSQIHLCLRKITHFENAVFMYGS